MMGFPPYGRTMEQMVQGILVVNTETIPGMMITETLGVVSGSTVRAKNIAGISPKDSGTSWVVSS